MTFHGKFKALLSAALLSLAFLATSAVAFDLEEPTEQAYFNGIKNLSGLTPSTLPPAAAAPVVSTPAASAELHGFWERLRTGTSEQICRKAQIQLKKNIKIPTGVLGLGGGVKRAIRKFPDGKLALLDEIGLDLSLNLSKRMLSLPDAAGLGLSVGVSSRFEGKSQVVRPLVGERFCREMIELVKFYEIKTILPATARRIVKMEVGEIWKLPLSMSIGFNVGVGANIQQMVKISLSARVSKGSNPAVTLKRLAKDKLRLRIRLDRLTVKSVGVSASTAEIPLDALGLGQAGAMAADILGKAVPQVARPLITDDLFNGIMKKEINNYLAVKLAFTHSRFSGKKLLIEFILNPEDAEQMASLEEFLRGDLGLLNKFLDLHLELNNFSEDTDALYGLDALEDADDEGEEALDAESSFVGTDVYNGRSNHLGVNIPVVANNSVSWGSAYHRYQSTEHKGETIHVQQRNRSYNGNGLNLPFMGAVFKHNTQRDVIVFNKENPEGEVTKPVMLYQQYEGVIGRGAGTVENMLQNVNGMLRYVGTNGSGTNSGSQLPVSSIMAPLPENPNDPDFDPSDPSKRYKSGVMSVKLLISERGVQDIIFAPAEAVMKAYINVIREKHADKAAKDGAVPGQEAQLAALTDIELAEACNPFHVVDNLAYAAARRLIKALASVRSASDWKTQSERLAGAAAGEGPFALKYEDFFKVVLQLVKPADVSAAVYVHLDPKKKGVANVTQNYNYFNTSGRGYDATLSDVANLRDRFATPSELSD